MAAERVSYPRSRHHTHCLQLICATGLRDQKYGEWWGLRFQIGQGSLCGVWQVVLPFWVLASWLLEWEAWTKQRISELSPSSHILCTQRGCWRLPITPRGPRLLFLKRRKQKRMSLFFFLFSLVSTRWSSGGFASAKGNSPGCVTAVPDIWA